jgi:NADH:ubiquinone reductase (H+-translocating)
MQPIPARPRVVIVGGGFGGLYAARALRKVAVDVTVLDRRNFHLFQPLLYQVATGALSPANIAAPLRTVLRRQLNTRVLLGEVIDFDLAGRQVFLLDGRVPYDILIVAAGVRHAYFGHPEWEDFAPGLKTVEDATTMRRRILSAFEVAERTSDPEARAAWLTFVIVGGGPTGVELAGAVGETAHHTLRRDFRAIDPRTARVLLVEGQERVLAPYPPKISVKATQALERLGVTVQTGVLVTDVQADRVTLKRMVPDGEPRFEVVRTHTILWGAGVQGSPLARKLSTATGAGLDKADRILVQPDLTLPGHPEVFVLGDMATFLHQTGKPLPGVAQVAMQQGDYAARVIRCRVESKPLPGPFKYSDHGNMATIGRSTAVADLGWVSFNGYLAWLAWLFIHLFYLIQFENRVLVMFQWAWNYFTRNRSARLITWQPSPTPPPPTVAETPRSTNFPAGP